MIGARAPLRRTEERGLTLIELLVAIAILTAAIVFMVGAFANLERNAQVSTTQSKLEDVMRVVGDYLRAPQANGTTYQYCASSYTVPSTINGVSILSSATPPGPVSSATVSVATSTSASRAGQTAPFPLKDCTTGAFAPQQACSNQNCDWGLQRLTVSLTSTSGLTLTRVVYKASTP